MKTRKVSWTKLATKQFRAAIEFIREDSEQNAEKVKVTILNKIDGLKDDITVHRKDPYKKTMTEIIFILNCYDIELCIT
jgi:hypothetical protein